MDGGSGIIGDIEVQMHALYGGGIGIWYFGIRWCGFL